MVALLVNLADPRGTRYAGDDRARAELTWATAGRRSFAKTAEITGVSPNTLRAWAKDDGWVTRADAADAEAAELAKVALAARLTDELDKCLAKLIALRDGAQSEKVQLDAALALLGIAGVAPVRQGELTLRQPPKPAVPKKTLTDYMSAPDSELED